MSRTSPLPGQRVATDLRRLAHLGGWDEEVYYSRIALALEA